MYIPGKIWTNIHHDNTRQGVANIPDVLTEIRTSSKLQTLMQEHPEVEQWITQPYNAEEIKTVLANLKKIINQRTKMEYQGSI